VLERLVVIWCPDLLEEGPRGEEARRFAKVMDQAYALCPWAHPIRLGVCALPARGPARFFGGEEAVVSRLAAAVGEVEAEVEAQSSQAAGAAPAGTAPAGTAPAAVVGVADGLFGAVLAARSGVIVPTGETAAFLASFSVATLGRPDLAVTLQRLGVKNLGQFAALPPASISDRFGADAAACHAVARGESGELPGLRDSAVTRRLRVARGEDHPERDTGTGAGVRPSPVQPGFFGGASEADVRAARSFVRVQERLGIEAVLVGRLQGGRDPAGQSVLLPWGSPEVDRSMGGSGTAGVDGADERGGTVRAAGRVGAGTGPGPGGAVGGAPWPGRLPPPAPSDVLQEPPRAELVDAEGNAMVVSGRGLLDAAIDRLSVDGGPWQEVVGWAGPWPVTERWWEVRRRRARLQVVTADGVARLLCSERGRWWVEAVYD
jgi:protein ImuB